MADLEARHIGVKLGEEWWREVVVEKTVQRVRDALDAGDLAYSVTLLSVRVYLTGRDGILVDLVPPGHTQVGLMVRGEAPINT